MPADVLTKGKGREHVELLRKLLLGCIFHFSFIFVFIFLFSLSLSPFRFLSFSSLVFFFSSPSLFSLSIFSSRTETDFTSRMIPPTRNGHAPRSIGLRKSRQPVNPYYFNFSYSAERVKKK